MTARKRKTTKKKPGRVNWRQRAVDAEERAHNWEQRASEAHKQIHSLSRQVQDVTALRELVEQRERVIQRVTILLRASLSAGSASEDRRSVAVIQARDTLLARALELGEASDGRARQAREEAESARQGDPATLSIDLPASNPQALAMCLGRARQGRVVVELDEPEAAAVRRLVSGKGS